MFQTGQIKKTYWAVVNGSPEADEGVIDFPLAKQSADTRRWWMKVDLDGQQALTEYRVLSHGDFGLTLLELSPITGRTHQLRVHCQAMGFPILGDAIYGTRDKLEPSHLHLHARSVEIPYNPKRPVIQVVAPLPEHIIDTCAEYNLAYEE